MARQATDLARVAVVASMRVTVRRVLCIDLGCGWQRASGARAPTVCDTEADGHLVFGSAATQAAVALNARRHHARCMVCCTWHELVTRTHVEISGVAYNVVVTAGCPTDLGVVARLAFGEGPGGPREGVATAILDADE